MKCGKGLPPRVWSRDGECSERPESISTAPARIQGARILNLKVESIIPWSVCEP